MSSGMSLASVARVRCIRSASSFDTTSFDIMQQRYPCSLNKGTICSISRVLPEPTGPPIPTLGIRLATAEHRTSLCNKHSQLGPLVLHLHDFCQWRQLPQLANVPSHLCRINVARKLRQETLAFNVGNDAEPDCRSNEDRKSTRLNSSHGYISYAGFCLKKKIDTVASIVWSITSSIID